MTLSSIRGHDDLDFLFSQRSDQVMWRAFIGHDGVNDLQFTKHGKRLPPELRMIKAEDNLARSVDHGALDFDQQTVRVAHALERNAAGAHDGHIGAYF